MHARRPAVHLHYTSKLLFSRLRCAVIFRAFLTPPCEYIERHTEPIVFSSIGVRSLRRTEHNLMRTAPITTFLTAKNKLHERSLRLILFYVGVQVRRQACTDHEFARVCFFYNFRPFAAVASGCSDAWCDPHPRIPLAMPTAYITRIRYAVLCLC